MRRIRVAMVTNTPAPYRLPALQRLAEFEDIELHAVYCTQPHIDTSLGAQAHGFPVHWLTGRYRAYSKRFMHSDLGVVRVLRELRPDVVITCGYIPTFLFAFAWARLAGVPHIVMTDGTLISERGLTSVHRWVRKIVWRGSGAFVGACEGSLDLFRAAGIQAARLFKAPLAVDNERYAQAAPADGEQVDFLFCGRLLPLKRPEFALEVAAASARKIGRRTTIDFAGEGSEEPALRAQAAALKDLVQIRFLGHLPQAQLPQRYAAARVFLFPSEFDVWGVVANEACAAGVPVLVSPHAGAAHELIVDGENGRVLPLDLESWSDAAAALLLDDALRARMGARGSQAVRSFSFEAAAEALLQAVRLADSGRRSRA